MNPKNRLLLFTLLISVFIIVIFFVLRFTGFAVTIPSSVTVETRIIVNSSFFNGSTTNFSGMSNNQLRNIIEMILEKTEYGKIIFQGSTDLTQDSKNGTVDLDTNVNISNNHIEINTSELSSLNKPAVIYLFNLNFTNPRVTRNGEACPYYICQKINYSSGVLIFNVTNFADYRAEETPEITEIPETGAGGGGGGGGASLIRNFSIDKDLIKVSLKQGESAKDFLIIKNTGNIEIKINLEISKLEKFMILNEDKFVLKVGESKMIRIDLFAKENQVADSYLGKIIASGAGINSTVSVILEIKERNPLFDIKTELLNKVVRSGGKIRANITITNVGDLRNIDAILYTAIKNFDGKVINYKDMSIAIEKEISVQESIAVPALAEGKYVFYSRVSYKNISASSSEGFEVSNNAFEILRSGWIYLNIILIVVVIIVIVWIIYLKRKIKLKKERLSKYSLRKR